MSAISPRHSSVARGRKLKLPQDIDSITVTEEQRKLIEEQALSIFNSMTNANHSFRDALSAILMTGMQWGVESVKERVGE